MHSFFSPKYTIRHGATYITCWSIESNTKSMFMLVQLWIHFKVYSWDFQEHGVNSQQDWGWLWTSGDRRRRQLWVGEWGAVGTRSPLVFLLAIVDHPSNPLSAPLPSRMRKYYNNLTRNWNGTKHTSSIPNFSKHKCQDLEILTWGDFRDLTWADYQNLTCWTDN